MDTLLVVLQESWSSERSSSASAWAASVSACGGRRAPRSSCSASRWIRGSTGRRLLHHHRRHHGVGRDASRGRHRLAGQDRVAHHPGQPETHHTSWRRWSRSFSPSAREHGTSISRSSRSSTRPPIATASVPRSRWPRRPSPPRWDHRQPRLRGDGGVPDPAARGLHPRATSSTSPFRPRSSRAS